jgi:pyruvate,water dikinase
MAKTKLLCTWDNEPHRAHTIFTQGNVNEVLPGVTTPLYADLAAWWDYYWVDGVVKELDGVGSVNVAPPPQFNQLGFMGGRWTVNVSINLELSAMWAVGEGTSMLQSFFEGGDAIVATASEDQSAAARAHALIETKWKASPKLVRAGDRLSRGALAKSRKLALHAMSARALVDHVEESVRLWGKLFETHYYVTVGGGEYASLLGGLLDRYFKKRPAEWVTTLTSGLGNVESSRPGKAIWDLSRLVAARKGLAAAYRELSSHDILVRIAAPPDDDWAAFAAAFRDFIAEFGWRGQRESDPATPTWDESPEFVLGAIAADLDAPLSASPYTREARATRQREKLEARILARIPARERKAFTAQLRQGQVLAREREGAKATWARMARVVRRDVLELGRRFAAGGTIEHADDVWFLRWTEVQAAAAGSLDKRIAKRAVTSRRKEFADLQDTIMPDGVFTWPAELVKIGEGVDASQREFKALGVSPGVAEGPARVILNVYDDAEVEPGEILVAPVTDAPWTPLFIPAAAVVVELGGVLSHAATVAREFGIPGVSGVKDATRIIKTGQRLRVDGNTGTVTILK